MSHRSPSVTACRRALTVGLIIGALAGAGFGAGVTYAVTDKPAQVTPEQVTVQSPAEDEPGWNCLTMGNYECGPDYIPVSTSLAEILTKSYGPYNWESCVFQAAEDDTFTVACPDGYVVTF